MSDAVQNLVLIGFVLFLALWLGQILVKWRGVARDAEAAWAAYQNELPTTAAELTAARFRKIYFRVHGPRGALYVLVAIAAILAVSPLALAMLSGVWRGIWQVSGRPEYFTEGYLVWQFYMFFGLVASWVWVSALIARRYHTNAPLSFDDELKKYVDAA